ncbi:hypothetical protein [Flavobacterium sp. LM4]|uniref:hypothetical protein n=1 Tax=Flavobacterium sp. LM4 TaxID=1938609 RepID=UPI0009948D4D|nr:hypothetical protein [Flavobacterium sp. LM4]OOV20567.1 hypothetical protein BXU10_13540 [Flavobacterium sp. LM4]
METKELRRKLIKDFGKFIEDDSKLEILESFLMPLVMMKKSQLFPIPIMIWMLKKEKNIFLEKISPVLGKKPKIA